MKWLVEVERVEGEEKVLRAALEKLGYRLDERRLWDDAPAMYITSPRFDKFHNHRAVWDCARHLESTLGEVAELVPGINSHFELNGSVCESLPDGSLRQHVFESLSVSIQASTSVSETVSKDLNTTDDIPNTKCRDKKREYELVQSEEKIELINKYVSSALKNPTVLEVLRLSREKQNPLNLGHIFDLIQHDIGDETEELVSKTEITRFTRSINHPDVFGKKSRHVVSNQEPPPNPMSLNEAQKFISTLRERWIELKARKR